MSQRFQRDSTVAVLLNLDASSPNANTAALAKSEAVKFFEGFSM
jgi:hypothetical protein